MEEGQLDNIVTLLDEEGRDVQFDLLLSFDYEGKRYVALLPVDEVEGVASDEVLLLETVSEKGEEVFRTIDNPILLDEVFDAFTELFEAEIAEFDGEE